MFEVETTDEFDRWIDNLRDRQGRAAILRRIDRLKRGLTGDVEPVGEGVSELRIHIGPGYRVYFVRRGQRLIIVLSGGDKSSQAEDIKRAKGVASAL